MYRCPKCHGMRIDQYLSPEGPMICMDCGFTVEDKMATPNPFYVPDEVDPAAPPEAKKLPLGEQMAALYRRRRKRT